ncbi:MAG: hypothetical protein M0Z66_15175 [Thermaerobacter sp.]|nr:hypothetical protein [Thermaerobacter sp.]
MPRDAGVATTEFVLPSGHRADVAFMSPDDSLRAIFEVLHLHAVDDDKAKAIAATPWAELRAEDILTGNQWTLVRDHLKPWTCRRCREIARRSVHLPLLVPGRKFVECPLPEREAASVIDDCPFCPHFAETDGRSIVCLGGKLE